MFSLNEAKRRAAALSEGETDKFIVFKTPEDAACNQPPMNMFNTGQYTICRVSERADYEAGGAEFV